MRVKWLWQAKTQPDKPWAELHIQVHSSVRGLFFVALITSVGDANSTLFWTDNWLHGKSIAFLPQLFSSDSKRRAKRHTVCEAMVQNSWVLDIQGALSVTALAEYLEVRELIVEVQLLPNTPDQHSWRFSCSSGHYSTKSAYKTLFIGSISFEPCELI